MHSIFPEKNISSKTNEENKEKNQEDAENQHGFFQTNGEIMHKL